MKAPFCCKSRRDGTVAVVVGLGSYNDLGVVRSCGEAGMGVILLAPRSMIVPIYRSRHVDQWFDVNTRDSEEVLHALELVSKQCGGRKLILYPTGDRQAVILDCHRKTLSRKYVVPGIVGDIKTAMDKLEMSRIAQCAGLKVPRTEQYQTSELSASTLEYPCIIKPAASIAGEKSDIVVCRTPTEAVTALDTFSRHSTNSVIVQELIDGENQYEIAVPGVALTDGTIIVGGYLHKYRTFGNGSTVYASYRPDIDPELRESVKRYVSLSGYHGIFDIEFLVNDSGTYFVECNYRNGAYGYVATCAGLNLPGLYAGQTHVKKLHKLTMMEERADILNAMSGRVSRLTWLWQMITADVHLWFSFRDPMPIVAHWLCKFGFK